MLAAFFCTVIELNVMMQHDFAYPPFCHGAFSGEHEGFVEIPAFPRVFSQEFHSKASSKMNRQFRAEVAGKAWKEVTESLVLHFGHLTGVDLLPLR